MGSGKAKLRKTMKTIILLATIAAVIAAKRYADAIPLPTAQDTGRAGEVTK